jgi:hypothetical protein
MTAIAAVWSPDGFVIGSDSLHTDRAGNDVSDKAQKIFSLSFSNDIRFAFAWRGASSLGSFNFEQATAKSHSHLSKSPFPESPDEYFGKLARQIFCELLNHFGENMLPFDLVNSEFPSSQALFVGYAKGNPLWVEIIFDHDTRQFLPPTVEGFEYSPKDFKVFSGSLEVWKAMDAEERVFQPLDLGSAAEEIGEYIQRCIQGRHLLPDCDGIGGRVCLAAVTANDVRWIPWPIGA